MGLRRRALICISSGGLLAAGMLSSLPARAAASPTVWPLGDSITYGLSGGTAVGATYVEGQTPGGYRGILDSDLGADGVAHQFVGTMAGNSTVLLTREGQSSHDGHPGYRIDQIAADLDGVAGGPSDNGGYWMTSTSQPVVPAVAIVLLGGNDILQRYDPSTTFPTANGEADFSDPAQVSIFVSDLAGRLRMLLDKIESLHPGTAVVLSDLTPIETTTNQPDAVTQACVSAIQGVAQAEASSGVKITFVDLWSQFVESTPGGLEVIPGTIGPDRMHPTASGYQMIASLFRTPVESMLASG
ncbi:MAG TPA: GDSL-type esterase/lipase family protein [Acidimicrobiales bacterium]|nr:GDSL-type esterase/lipase family protein [Acidimicrobiales bacterium]